MAIVRWDPFQNLTTLQDRINRLFEESFPGAAGKEEEISLCAWRPVVDIYDAGDAIVIKAELPGVKKEDVSIEVKGNSLTLKGERVQDEEIAEESYYRRERCCGTFQRVFTLPDTVGAEHIKASFKDGILKVEITKPQQQAPKQISVDID
jgi:HSP20 family protein